MQTASQAPTSIIRPKRAGSSISRQKALLDRFQRQLDASERIAPMHHSYQRIDPYIIETQQAGHTYSIIIYNVESKSWYDHENYIDESFVQLHKHKSIRSGDVIFDVGCNAGFTTCWYALATGPKGKVHAFDPFPWNAIVTQFNAELNGLRNVTVHQVGIGDVDKRIDLSLYDSKITSSHGPHVISAQIHTLAHYRNLNPNILKIDIEGAEYELSQADLSTFEHLRFCFLELHPEFIAARGLEPHVCLNNFMRHGFEPWRNLADPGSRYDGSVDGATHGGYFLVRPLPSPSPHHQDAVSTGGQRQGHATTRLLRDAFHRLPAPIQRSVRQILSPVLRSTTAQVHRLHVAVEERDLLIRAREDTIREREEVTRQREAEIAELEECLRARELAGTPTLDDAPVFLGDRKVLARMKWGGRLIVPSYNLDVALMCLRDRVYEPATTQLIRECLLPGQVAVGVGANFGYFAVLQAMLVGHTGRVVAIEANPHIVPYLIENAYLNGALDTISIFQRAAWSSSGEELNLCFAPAYLGGGSASELWASDQSARPVAATLEDALWDHRLVLTNTDANGRVHGNIPVIWFKVPTRTVDEICADVSQAHLIHLDIEGAEAHALHGARKLVERSSEVRIIFEWASHRWKYGNAEARAMWERTWGWLVEQGFRVREVTQASSGYRMSKPLTFDYLSNEAAGGNFIAVRPNVDWWAT